MNDIPPTFNNNNSSSISNVAVASAITSYARMIMVPVKTNIDNPPLYMDTDSVFLSKPLPPHLIGPNIGQFKDELGGHIITEALFLAPKMYGYKCNNFEKVVISGVKPGSVSYDELVAIWKGKTITKDKHMIIKDFKDLSIKSRNVSINLSLDLINSVKTPVFNKEGLLDKFTPKIIIKT